MNRAARLRELAIVFGTLGVIGFGGPAAHIALMRRELREGTLDPRRRGRWRDWSAGRRCRHQLLTEL